MTATTATKPRDLRPGDVVRIERVSAELTVETFDDTIESVETVHAGRYKLVLAKDGVRYIPARENVNVVGTGS